MLRKVCRPDICGETGTETHTHDTACKKGGGAGMKTSPIQVF